MQAANVRTEEDLDEWVKEYSVRPVVYEAYKAALVTCKSMVAIQYPGKHVEWPRVLLQPCYTDLAGERRYMFVHAWEFPDGFKTGVMVLIGNSGEEDGRVCNVTYIDKRNILPPRSH